MGHRMSAAAELSACSIAATDRASIDLSGVVARLDDQLVSFTFAYSTTRGNSTV